MGTCVLTTLHIVSFGKLSSRTARRLALRLHIICSWSSHTLHPCPSQVGNRPGSTLPAFIALWARASARRSQFSLRQATLAGISPHVHDHAKPQEPKLPRHAWRECIRDTDPRSRPRPDNIPTAARRSRSRHGKVRSASRLCRLSSGLDWTTDLKRPCNSL